MEALRNSRADKREQARQDMDYEPRRISSRCQCGPDLPGTCPGPANCPNADCDDEEETAEDEEMEDDGDEADWRGG